MAMEALRTQLDALRVEMQQLKVENRRLRENNPEHAKWLEEKADLEEKIENLTSESAHHKGLYEQLLQDQSQERSNTQSTIARMEEEREQLVERNHRLQEDYNQLDEQLQMSIEQHKDRAELELLRALDSERKRSDERELRLNKQVEDLQRQVGMLSGAAKTTERRSSEASQLERDRSTEARMTRRSSLAAVDSPSTPLPDRPGNVTPFAYPAITMPQQLPPLQNFHGNKPESDQETFVEWLEQFEMVADLAQWNDHARLVNIATRLRGQASAFYRSCTSQQRGSYELLVSELKKRFTTVRIQSVQSSLFHERKQGPKESVDEYAQSLRALFNRAYPTTNQGSREAEDLGRSVLAYQFVSGLRNSIKSRIAGMEGSFDELLVRARFEEAKQRDLWNPVPAKLGSNRSQLGDDRSNHRHGSARPDREQDNRGHTVSGGERRSNGTRCRTCGSPHHLQKNCPQESKGGPAESPGGRTHDRSRRIGNLTPSQSTSKETVEELRRRLQEAERQEAVETHSVSMNVITQAGGAVGTRPTAKTYLEGTAVEALLDTGSPVSIVSMDFLLEALGKKRLPGQSRSQWSHAVQSRMKSPLVTLRDYSGGRLNIVCRIPVEITREGYTVNADIHVQMGAPTSLLIGTDFLHELGYSFLQNQKKEKAIDLLVHRPVEVQLTPTKEPVLASTNRKDSQEEVGQVCLIQATKLPGRHQKLIKAKANGVQPRIAALFEPEEVLADHGLRMVDTLTTPDEDGYVVLVVENSRQEPVRLERGQVLGTIQPTSLCEDEAENDACEGEAVRTLVPEKTSQEGREHKERLRKVLKVDHGNLTEDQYCRLKEFLLERHEQFALDSSELGTTNVVTHTINTKDHPSIHQQPRRIPFALHNTIEEMVQKMMNQGVIRPSRSPWASPVVLVRKKDGSHRFCVDYRRLNSVTKMDVFPLPRIDDTLDLLAKSQYFSTLDLASGYWQVGMDPSSREKTAFVTHSGLYEFNVMPFGLCNAPATFQRLMETVLAGLTRKTCLDYIDDILVIGRTFDEHLDYLTQVFDRLKAAGLKLKAEKCSFGRGEVEYLGYVVSKKGLAPQAGKVKAVKDFPTPVDLKTLRSFLGLASYYRRFIPQFSVVASPLHALTRKNVDFSWDSVCEEAFQLLKGLLTTAPLLAFPDFAREFLLETDASGIGIGAVLAQKGEDGITRPNAYASRTLQPHEKNYGVTELEALAVVWAVKHFRPYLYGHRCTVLTDHEALKSLLNTPHPSGKLARWGMAIQELDLNIIYRPGKQNRNADALSRAPLSATDQEEELDSLSGLVATTRTSQSTSQNGGDTLPERQRSDPTLKSIIDFLDTRTLPDEEKKARELILMEDMYQLTDNVLYHVEKDKTLRLIPPTEDREKLFQEAHQGKFGAHLRDAKIHAELAKHYWWPGMRSDVIRWCRACLTCATRQIGQATRPLLTPIPVSGPFDRMGVDVIQFPTSHSGNKYAVVFMDYLTKWPEVFPVADQSALTIATLLVEKIVSRHGVPTQLLSDRGQAFMSHLINELCQYLGVKKINTTAYHPQTDGLVERFNRTLTGMLSKKVENSGKDWDAQLPYVLFAYRVSMQESTKESPFYLLYGRDPRLPTELDFGVSTIRQVLNVDTYKEEVVSRMNLAWSLAQQKVKEAQVQQKMDYDRRARPRKFFEGERVFIFMPAAKNSKAHKFARPFHGPFRVLEANNTGVVVRPVNQPDVPSIRVALNRVRRCPNEIGNDFWPAKQFRRKRIRKPLDLEPDSNSVELEHPLIDLDEGREKEPVDQRTPNSKDVWKGRLRKRSSTGDV